MEDSLWNLSYVKLVFSVCDACLVRCPFPCLKLHLLTNTQRMANEALALLWWQSALLSISVHYFVHPVGMDHGKFTRWDIQRLQDPRYIIVANVFCDTAAATWLGALLPMVSFRDSFLWLEPRGHSLCEISAYFHILQSSQIVEQGCSGLYPL